MTYTLALCPALKLAEVQYIPFLTLVRGIRDSEHHSVLGEIIKLMPHHLVRIQSLPGLLQSKRTPALSIMDARAK